MTGCAAQTNLATSNSHIIKLKCYLHVLRNFKPGVATVIKNIMIYGIKELDLASISEFNQLFLLFLM